ncbi:NAD(P)-binding oxidoreductase [Algoriphagus sp.]|uniref:NAD(P)-dependent oxidoreductase n=1 Tax=Algoriphagus sp. TaxID=1872435 RepID=UPI0026298BCC|nr:NAD(P)-binding oxidoreductase [Algoriphagus sp.]
MKTLVLGASGSTGKLLVEQLIGQGQHLKVIVRPLARIPENWTNYENLTLIQAFIHEMSADELAVHLEDCNVVASCLGHHPSLRGIYGKPRKLVTDALRLVCAARIKNSSPRSLKILVMNTAGNSNRDLRESLSLAQRVVVAMIRILLPPHRDNEAASDFLRLEIGQVHPFIQWAIVRPDTLMDENSVSNYTTHRSPTRSAIFNPGKTSRVNVAHFMASLIQNQSLWEKWKGQMPVIYNRIDPTA